MFAMAVRGGCETLLLPLQLDVAASTKVSVLVSVGG